MENFPIKKIDLKFNFIFWSIGFCAFIKLKVVHAAKTEFVQFNVPCDFPSSFSCFIFWRLYFLREFRVRQKLSHSQFSVASSHAPLSTLFVDFLSLFTFSQHNTRFCTHNKHKKKKFFCTAIFRQEKNENEEKMKNQKNIFQLTASVDVCVYGNRDAFSCIL